MRDLEYFPPRSDQNDFIAYRHVFTMWIQESEYQELKRWCVDHGAESRLLTYLGDYFHMRVTTTKDDIAMLFKLTYA